VKEIEKLDNGDWYYFLDQDVVDRKARAAKLCQEFNEIPATEPKNKRLR
jgi:Maltose acetyltransferase.